MIAKWWRKRQRQIDLKTLWPALKADANTIFHARYAFHQHCKMDQAWTKDFDEWQLIHFVNELK